MSEKIFFSFEIPGRLPGLNEIVSQAQSNRYGYGSFKKRHTELCAQYAMVGCLPKIRRPVDMAIDWIEPNGKRDLDNVMAGTKFILDGLVLGGYLPNDTQEWVKSITHTFPPPNSKDPKVIIKLALR